MTVHHGDSAKPCYRQLKNFNKFSKEWSKRYARFFDRIIRELKEPKKAGFSKDILGSTLECLHRLSISSKCATIIVQAISRARFAQNLSDLLALAVLLAMRDVTSR